jgi:hypothetical protein
MPLVTTVLTFQLPPEPLVGALVTPLDGQEQNRAFRHEEDSPGRGWYDVADNGAWGWHEICIWLYDTGCTQARVTIPDLVEAHPYPWSETADRRIIDATGAQVPLSAIIEQLDRVHYQPGPTAGV